MSRLSTEIFDVNFSRSALGYNTKEVETFLDHVIDEVDKLEKQNYQMNLQLRDYEKRLSYQGSQQAVQVPVPRPVAQGAQQQAVPVPQPVPMASRPVQQTAESPAAVPAPAPVSATQEFKPAVFTPATFTPAPVPASAPAEAKPAAAPVKEPEKEPMKEEEMATAMLASTRKVCEEMKADAKREAKKLIEEAQEQATAQAEKMLRDKKDLEEEIEMLRASARDYRRRFKQLMEDQAYIFNSEKTLFDGE